MSPRPASSTIPVFLGVLAFLDGCSSTPDGTADADTSASTAAEGTSSGPGQSTTTADTGSEATGSVSTSSSEESTETSSSTGPLDPECGTATCGAPAPDGWSGPLIYTRVAPAAELPPCPMEAPSPGLTWLDGFIDPGPAICGCTCDEPQSDCYAYVYTHDTPDCDQYVDITMLVDECVNLDIPGFVRFLAYGTYYGGVCQPLVEEQIPPPGWNAAIRTCELVETPMACMDGGVCLPTPPEGFESTWCLSRIGDESCPAGPYTEKQLFHTGVEDDRDCSNCTCGTSAQDCTAAVLEVFSEPDCGGEPSGTVEGTQCTAVVGESFTRSQPNAETCAVVASPEPEGSITPVGEVTFCCLP